MDIIFVRFILFECDYLRIFLNSTDLKKIECSEVIFETPFFRIKVSLQPGERGGNHYILGAFLCQSFENVFCTRKLC